MYESLHRNTTKWPSTCETWLTGDKQGRDAVCACNQTCMRVGSGYEQDTRRILMRIVIFSPQIIQNQASSPCYRMLINDISVTVWSNILLLHMACLKFMWVTGISHGCVPYHGHALGHLRHGSYSK